MTHNQIKTELGTFDVSLALEKSISLREDIEATLPEYIELLQQTRQVRYELPDGEKILFEGFTYERTNIVITLAPKNHSIHSTVNGWDGSPEVREACDKLIEKIGDALYSHAETHIKSLKDRAIERLFSKTEEAYRQKISELKKKLEFLKDQENIYYSSLV